MQFLTHKVVMPLAHPKPGQSPYVTVLKTEEKGSDVNLASRLLRDGYRDNYDVAAIISNDSAIIPLTNPSYKSHKEGAN